MAENTTPVEYQVRTGTGAVVSQWADSDDAEHAADQAGRNAYVVFVELIDGQWTAQED